MSRSLQRWKLIAFVVLLTSLAGCVTGPSPVRPRLGVLAVETFLADIAQNVAGDRLEVEALMPIGAEPHSFEPTPRDVARVAACNALIVNGAGLEEFLDKLLENAGGQHHLIVASAGLTGRTPHADKVESDHAHEGDPHFWLDPNLVIKYVENIRDGLSQVDPAGADIYAANARAYIARLQELDRWIVEQVAPLPPERRLLVTNHESLGYWADRYGFRVIGTIVPGVSTGASPSAQQMAQLIDHIKASGAKAIFLETGANPQLAQQIARESGVQVVTELYTHSITPADGPAPTYIEMIKYNTQVIVEASR